MTPNHGYDPTDPRAQQQSPPRQGTPPQQPPGVGGQPSQIQPQPQPQPQPSSPPAQPNSGGRTQPPQAPQQPQPVAFGQGGTPPVGASASPGRQGVQSQPAMGAPPQQPRQQPPQRRQPSPRQRLQPITVDDIAAEDVLTAERDTPIPNAVASMAERDVGSVVVVEDSEPVGIVTDRKIALSLEDTPEVAQLTVGDLVSGDIVVAEPSSNVFDVVRMMGDNGIRRIPVVDDDGKVAGIVTLDDVIVLLGTELGNVAETIQAQIDRL